MNSSILNVTENECCGCEACAQACPKLCIYMNENDRGFFVPSVDIHKCVNCGYCKKICPELNEVESLNPVIKTYAAINKNSDEQKKSSSGGVFPIIAKYVIEHGGIVSGASWTDNLTVKHILVDSLDNLNLLRNSKYVQSQIGQSFYCIKKELSKNKLVLFSGTACQIGGLLRYLNHNSRNLITVEVACHGVPSPGMFRNYCKWREEQVGERIIKYTFRNRDKHDTGEHYMSCAEFEGGKKRYYYIDKDPYYSSFLSGKTLRETCYNCKYKGKDRVSDITLSDFWGIEKEFKEFPAQLGVSAVLVNTPLGLEFFNKIKSEFILKECDANIVYSHNKSMVQSCKKINNSLSYSLKEDFSKLSVKLLEKKTLKKKFKSYIKRIIPSKMKYYLKRII